MCGIAGEIVFNDGNINSEWVKIACQLMAHRGPDGEGFYYNQGVTLGHRRLAIIDLAGGAQPLSYADERYWITFNGEIYNYPELKTELMHSGCEFRTNSDTEVLLAAYSTWGINFLQRLNGIFAFGIWDNLTGSLLLARDHFGIKPLLFHIDHDGLRFGSELKGLLAHPRVQHEVDPEALQDYLSLGYVLSPRTIIKGIRKLPAGHYLFTKNGESSITAYWKFHEFSQDDSLYGISEDEAIAGFEERLEQTVKSQMISDVPLGAFLSGGIDSSAIANYASKSTSFPLKTFSIGFIEKGYSELDYAGLAANHFGTEHYQQIVNPLSLDELSNLIWYYDEPLGDTSIIPTYFVSKLARQHVKVVLSGDGGDELMAGYDTYLADLYQSIYRKIPSWLHKNVFQFGASLIPADNKKVSTSYKIKQFLSQAHTSPERAHFGWRLLFNEPEVQGLMGSQTMGSYSSINQYISYYDEVPKAPNLHRSLYVDIKTWLTDDILTKVDRASMACSLESRVPFLAPNLAEYVMRLSPQMKLKGLKRKYILKKAMEGKLPQTIINRQKRGFNSPISIWMRTVLEKDISDIFLQFPSNLVDLRGRVLQNLWREHCSGSADHGYKLWALLSLVLWEQNVLR